MLGLLPRNAHLLIATVAGCGAPEPQAASQPDNATSLNVTISLRSGDAWVEVPRIVPKRHRIKATVQHLLRGPTPAERDAGLALDTSSATGFRDFQLDDGIVDLTLTGGCDAAGRHPTVFDAIERTLGQFEEVRGLRIRDPDGFTLAPDSPRSWPRCLVP